MLINTAQILPKNFALRILFIALALFVFSASVISVSASLVILDQSYQTGVSEIYTYEEIESSVGAKDDRTGGLSRVLSTDKVGADGEVLAEESRVAAKGAGVSIGGKSVTVYDGRNNFAIKFKSFKVNAEGLVKLLKVFH